VTGLLWASAVSLTGYWIGRLFELRVESFEEHLVVVILAFGAFGSLVGYTIKHIVGRQMAVESRNT
jgi:membrane protein DedA with SNARE-associated domain